MIMNIKDTDLTNVEAMLSDIINNSDYGLEEIAELCKSGGSPIKSIQRGKVTAGTTGTGSTNSFKLYSYYATSNYIDITIAPVNVGKTEININSYNTQGILGELINNTTLRVYFDQSDNVGEKKNILYGFAWQVVEFV